MIRNKDNTFNFFIEDPIYPVAKELTEENIKEMNRKMLKILEKYISTYSTQWLMIHRMWAGDEEESEEII